MGGIKNDNIMTSYVYYRNVHLKTLNNNKVIQQALEGFKEEKPFESFNSKI